MRARLGSLLLAVVVAFAAAPACSLFMGPSKIAHGQLYRSGDGRYDPYFAEVHEEQVKAADWPSHARDAKKPIVKALALTPGASEDTILDATRERAKKHGGSAPALAGPVAATKRLEAERARRLRAASERLLAMADKGKGLKDQADEDYANRGADKADEKKTDKAKEIRRELSAAVSVCNSLARDAQSDAKDADDFAEDLGQALEAKETPKRHRRKHSDEPAESPPPKPEPKPEPPKPEPPKHEAPKPVAKKHPAKRPHKSAEKKPAKKKPAEEEPDEVFSP